jgi:DNA-binding GntR family transcriptional regulator
VAAVTDAIRTLISDEELAQMTALLDRWEEKAARGEDVSAEDRNFHRMLYTPLGNKSLIGLIDIFWVIYHSLAIQSLGMDHQPVATVTAHRDLLAAVKARDVALAVQRMREHFRNLEARFAGSGQFKQNGAPASERCTRRRRARRLPHNQPGAPFRLTESCHVALA